jgi:hypothetical protein
VSDIEKGEIVEATAQLYCYDVRANKSGHHAARWVTVGQELEVTSVGRDSLNVRLIPHRITFRDGERNVFRISRGAVRRVRQVGVPPEGAIPLDVPGLAWLWEDASRLAERFGFCAEFDRLADALGAPGRERDFRVQMINEDGIRIVATVRARSRSLAKQRILSRIAASAPLELTGAAS